MQDIIKKQNDIIEFAKSLINRASDKEGEKEIVTISDGNESFKVEFSNYLDNGVYKWMFIGISRVG